MQYFLNRPRLFHASVRRPLRRCKARRRFLHSLWTEAARFNRWSDLLESRDSLGRLTVQTCSDPCGTSRLGNEASGLRRSFIIDLGCERLRDLFLPRKHLQSLSVTWLLLPPTFPTGLFYCRATNLGQWPTGPPFFLNACTFLTQLVELCGDINAQ